MSGVGQNKCWRWLGQRVPRSSRCDLFFSGELSSCLRNWFWLWPHVYACQFMSWGELNAYIGLHSDVLLPVFILLQLKSLNSENRRLTAVNWEAWPIPSRLTDPKKLKMGRTGLIQWWRYTRARQVKWPGWKIHRPAYCFASVIVWTENKNVTISDRFICFILTVKQPAALAACVLMATTKKWSSPA